MYNKGFRVGDIRRVIAESAAEFKPVVGKNVISNNKKNNEKSYNDSKKNAKLNINGEKKENDKELGSKDANRTMLDLNPRINPSNDYKERIKAQALGYTSELEMNNDIEKAADFEGNKKIYKQFTDSAKELNSQRADLAHSGLQARMRDKKDFEKNQIFENTKLKPKRLIFKHTKFVNEQQVLVRVPEAYKVDGQIIEMCDRYGNTYIVECSKNDKFNSVEANIIMRRNDKQVNEQMSQIQRLIDYDDATTSGRCKKYNALNENDEMVNILNSIRK